MDDFFSLDGPLIGFLEKVGQLIILGILWLLLCIPIITFGASTTALYYAAVKSVRRGRGYPVREFLKIFKKNLIKGSLLTISFVLILVLAFLGREYINGENVRFLPANQGGKLTLFIIYDGIIAVVLMVALYVFPVLSRFEMKLMDVIKLSFVMSVRYIYFTIPLAIFIYGGVYVQYRLLPIWMVIIWPGIMTYISSFLVERTMKNYITKTDENKDEWYIF